MATVVRFRVGGDPVPERVTRIRMDRYPTSATADRDRGGHCFAERGYEATSIEEIAQRANVSKPVVYEHFGGKEGLYAVVVDREMSRLLEMITSSLSQNRSRVRVERVALALLTYVEEHTDGFRILVRDSVRCRAQWDIFEPPQRRDQSGGLPVGGGLPPDAVSTPD